MSVQKKSRGFTLIELLVVVTILGLLASIVLTSLASARVKSRDAKRQGDLQEMQKALELYNTQNGSYPNPNVACSVGTGDVFSSSLCWSTLIPTAYIPSMPIDPQNTDLGNCGTTANCHVYHYCVYNNNQNYIISVNLENPAPTGTFSNQVACPIGGPNYYWVGSE